MATNQTGRRIAVALAATIATALWHGQIGAQEPTAAPGLTLPAFSACQPATQPVLPEKWRAVGLLEPFKPPRLFTTLQLVVGEFVYDAAGPAMRATLYGLQSQSLDLLVADESTYLLIGPYQAPTDCFAVGPIWNPPSRNWLSAKAQCVGEASLISTDVQWWKTPAQPYPATTWYWYTTAAARLPWRTLFAGPSDDLAVIGQYSMTYFPTFEPLSSTNLPQLLQFCRSRAQPVIETLDRRAPDLQLLVARSPNEAGNAERLDRIGSLIPGLSLEACRNQALPQWPDRQGLGATTFMTPVKFTNNPFPTEVLYDWHVRSQRTRLFYPPQSSQAVGDALLIGGTGYGVDRYRNGKITCAPGVMPGTPQPDWPKLGDCVCRGVIDNNPVLSPGEITQVLTCNMEPPSVFWTWYTTASRPVVFYQTQSPPDVGTGLALADYYDWQPGYAVPPDVFDVPSQCLGAEDVARWRPTFLHSAAAGGSAGVPAQCYECHLGPE